MFAASHASSYDNSFNTVDDLMKFPASQTFVIMVEIQKSFPF